MASIITLSVLEASCVHAPSSGRVASISTFYMVEGVTVSFVAPTERIMAIKAGGQSGVFEYDRELEKGLEAARGSARTVTGIFLLTNDDFYQFSSSIDLTLKLVGLVVGGHAFLPEESAFVNFSRVPTHPMKPAGLTVGRHLSPDGADNPKKASPSQRPGPDAWLRFFKTPTAEWGETVSQTTEAEKPVNSWSSNPYAGEFGWTNYQPVVAATCGCGARYTSFPQLHAEYCPKYQPKNGEGENL